ncbi:MAG: hypothetical protein NXH75_04170 [Halobacteriovoraceae bacterium]|nr:hypothetical protein [Halobacteriovoraceae bacterium]
MMNKEVEEKYKSYPPMVKKEILILRKMILETVKNDSDIDFSGEALKWGEPSFLTKSSGSTLRLDWKAKSPEHISLFVNCQTKLISMFKELYPFDFEYVGNRELRIPLRVKYSKEKLKKCIELALKYNLVKDSF